MKRISDFEECRMDMKKMATLNGGATSDSHSSRSYVDCGDTTTMSWSDGYGYGGMYYTYDYKFDTCYWECPESSATVSNSNFSGTSATALGKNAAVLKTLAV